MAAAEVRWTSSADQTVGRGLDPDPIIAASGSEIEAGGQPSREPGGRDSHVDRREAMFNDGRTGVAGRIQLPRERITRLRGLMIDLDPGLLLPDNSLFPPAADPREFLGRIQPSSTAIRSRDAEVRSTGTGLHLLLWFDPVVELEDAGEQRRLGRPDPPDPGDPAVGPQRARHHGPDPAGGVDQLQERGPRRDAPPGLSGQPAARRRIRRAGEGRSVPRRRGDPARRGARDALPGLLGYQVRLLGTGPRGEVLWLRVGEPGDAVWGDPRGGGDRRWQQAIPSRPGPGRRESGPDVERRG